MRIRKGLVIVVLLLLVTSYACMAAELWSVRMARSEMQRYKESWMIDNSKAPYWGYTQGLVVKAFYEEWKHTGNIAYYNYAKVYDDSLITSKGEIKTLKFLSYNLDNINSGKTLFYVYAKTKAPRYKVAMDTLRKQLMEQPRTSEGGFWHKKVYPHQMWLDGIYMASPFLAQYASVFNKPEIYKDVVKQITLIASKTYDKHTGLFYHGWDESKQQRWADKKTGCSPNFWGRSIGWYAAALVDVLDYMPKQTVGRDSILTIVKSLAKGIAKYQDKSGVWYQVVDQGGREGNYKESSATALYSYFLLKAINRGYLPKSYIPMAKRAFNGMIKEFVKKEADGTYTITNCCAVAGLGGDKNYRDGSYDYYIHERVIENDPKSVGPFILAAIEYEKMNKQIK